MSDRIYKTTQTKWPAKTKTSTNRCKLEKQMEKPTKKIEPFWPYIFEPL